jgi:hypothetical protein
MAADVSAGLPLSMIAAITASAFLLFQDGSSKPSLERFLDRARQASIAEPGLREYKEYLNPFAGDDDVDLDILVEESQVIVEAVIGERFSFRPTDDERGVLSDGTLTVVRWLKGKHSSNTLALVRPGGVLRASDDLLAQQIVRGAFRMPAPGKRHILFLQREGRKWRTTLGPQGAFEVRQAAEGEPTVQPCDLRADALVASRFRGAPLRELVSSIAAVVVRQPEGAKRSGSGVPE